MGRKIVPMAKTAEAEALPTVEFDRAQRRRIIALLKNLNIKRPIGFLCIIKSISADYLHYTKTDFNAIPRSSAKRNLELFLKEFKKTGQYMDLNHRAEAAFLDGLLILPNLTELELPYDSPSLAYSNKSLPKDIVLKVCNNAIANLTGQGNKIHDTIDWYVRELVKYYQEITGKSPTHWVRDQSKSASSVQTNDPKTDAGRFAYTIAHIVDESITNSNVNSVMERIVKRDRQP